MLFDSEIEQLVCLQASLKHWKSLCLIWDGEAWNEREKDVIVGFCCSLSALSCCSSINKDWKELRYKWKTDGQSLWVCCYHTGNPAIAEEQVGDPTLHIEHPCEDIWRILNISFHTKCTKCSNKLPSILLSVSKDFIFPKTCCLRPSIMIKK